MYTYFRSFLFLFCLQFSACTGDAPRTLAAAIDPSGPELPSRRDLSRQLREQGEILIAYSADSEELQAIAGRFQDTRGRLRFRPIADREVSREMLEEKIVFALGSPASNWISQELSSRTPFRITGEGIRFNGRSYGDAESFLSLPLYPNPFNQSIPVIWVSGASDEQVAAHLRAQLDAGWSLFGWNAGGYEIFQDGERILLGFFEDRTWEPDRSLQFEFLPSRDTMLQTEHFRFLAGNTAMSADDLEALADACETAAVRIRDLTGINRRIARINIYLYPSAEEKGLRLYNTDQAHIDEQRRSVHMVYDDIYRSNDTGKENELLLRELLGPSPIHALERGLAVCFTGRWQLSGSQYWANLLYSSGNMAPLSQILDNEYFRNGSSYVMEALAASFVDFLLEEWGRETFLERYRHWQPSEAEIVSLEAQWQGYLATQSKNFRREEWARKDWPRLRGFNFAHEGYAIYDGYISRKAGESLAKMAGLGSNAASIIPYSFLRDPRTPVPIPISDRPGTENDESVVNAIYSAKELGMVTILKPHIWFGGGRWPGDLEMQNEADWQAFFQYYYEWIRHYALMAEIHQVDMLIVGTEFAKATLAREDDWRSLIRKIRKLYSGKITYASNWGDEFENIGFWDELDYIGLDCYYPLSKQENASEKELNANFRDILRRVEKVQKKYDKPLLFTEIGFRSVPAPWRQPHAHPEEGAGYHGEHQRLCYEVVLRNLAGKDWCQGVMFWKWPSYLESRGAENTDYLPVGKPAEAVVMDWFGRMEN